MLRKKARNITAGNLDWEQDCSKPLGIGLQEIFGIELYENLELGLHENPGIRLFKIEGL